MKRREIRPPRFLDPIIEKILRERGGAAHFNETLEDINNYFENLGEAPVADNTLDDALKRRIREGAIKQKQKGDEYQLVLKGTPGFLFKWNDIPKNEYYNKKLVRYLAQKFGIEWVKTAKINKSDEGMVIKVYDEKNYLSLELNYERTEVNLKIDGETTKFIAKIEKGKVNIYTLGIPFQIVRNTAYERTLSHWRDDIYSQEIPEERNRKFVMYFIRGQENIRALSQYVNEKYTKIQDSQEAEGFFNRSLEAIGKLTKRTRILLIPPIGKERIPLAVINEALIAASLKKETVKGHGTDLPPSHFGFTEDIVDDL